MAITNCSISPANVTFINNGGDAIGNDVAVLYIVADSGYTVRKENFINNTGSQPWLQAIQMENTDQANLDILFVGSPLATVANQVKITVTLEPTYVMPSADTTLQIDIDDYGEYGGGQEVTTFLCFDDIPTVDASKHTVTDTFHSNLTTSSSTASDIKTTSVSGNLNLGTQTILTKTFTAQTGYYYTSIPFVTVGFGQHSSRLDFSNQTITYDQYNRITAVTFVVTYLTIDGDESIYCDDKYYLQWTHSMEQMYAEIGSGVDGAGSTKSIKFLNIDTSDIPAKGAERTLQVIGSPGAIFTLVIDQEDNHTYNFTTDTFTASSTSLANQTLDSTGVYSKVITFPPVTDDDNYDVTITAGSSTSLASTVPSTTVTYDINQYALTTMTLATASASHSAKYADDTLSTSVFTFDSTVDVDIAETRTLNVEDNPVKKEFSFVLSRTGSHTFGSLIRQPVFGDFTNISADEISGTEWRLNSITATVADDTLSVTVTGVVEITQIGTSSFTSTLALDNFIAIS